MIYEYAIEPDVVATWINERQKGRFFIDKFGPHQGRMISCFPEKWDEKVKEVVSSKNDMKRKSSKNDMKRKRLEEILFMLKMQGVQIKRKNCCWDENHGSWIENAISEHARYPFHAILARKNPENRKEILVDEDIGYSPCVNWDVPVGAVRVERDANAMADAVFPMLSRCRWVKFIDPFFSINETRYEKTLPAFLRILNMDRPVEREKIEIHTKKSIKSAPLKHLANYYKEIIPLGLVVTLFHWQEKKGGQSLHNRYILTDIGGVSFSHGLDKGKKGQADVITRLDCSLYHELCDEYDAASTAFEEAEKPIVITGNSKE